MFSAKSVLRDQTRIGRKRQTRRLYARDPRTLDLADPAVIEPDHSQPPHPSPPAAPSHGGTPKSVLRLKRIGDDRSSIKVYAAAR